jgi:hypothetical protein
MRVSVVVPAGPFIVVVDGMAQMAGSTLPGGVVMGSMGQGCPG